MRQETGSNLAINDKKVSIQVKLGGRSFSADNIVVADDIEQVEFVVDTPRVTLAPKGEVSFNNAAELLQIAGKTCRNNELAVCSKLQHDIIAAIAIDSVALRSIMAMEGVDVVFTSPLLDMRHCVENCLTLDVTERTCYARLFDNGLQRAEAFDATTAEDILYIVAEWLKSNDIPIYIKGNTEAVRLLRKYYKRVICE